VDKHLEQIDPNVFAFLMSFAKDNDLQILDCMQLNDNEFPNAFL